MEILALLALLQIKHWYADFKIQTYMQTVKKGVWLDPIGMSHTGDHIKATLVVLTVFWFIGFVNVLVHSRTYKRHGKCKAELFTLTGVGVNFLKSFSNPN